MATKTNPCNTQCSLIHTLIQIVGKFGRRCRGPRALLAFLVIALLAGWALPWGSDDSPAHALSAGLAPASAEIAGEEQSIQDPITLRPVGSAPSLATIPEQALAIRQPVLAGSKTGRIFLRGALSWIPPEARGNLRFELNCLEMGDDSELKPGRFQAPAKVLSSYVLVDVELQEMDIFLIDVLQWIPNGGGKYSLNVRGTNYEMSSRPFLISRTDRQAVEKGLDKYVTVLPGKGARAWVEGRFGPLSPIMVQPLPSATSGSRVSTFVASGGLGFKTTKNAGALPKPRLRKPSDQQPSLVNTPAFRPRQVSIGLCRPGQTRSISRAALEPGEESTAFFASSFKEGPFQVIAIAEGLPPASIPVTLQLDTNTILTAPITFPPSAALAGQVHNLGGLRINLTAQRIVQPDQGLFSFGDRTCIWEGDLVRSFSAITTTDSDGRFAFEGLSPGTYRISPDPAHPMMFIGSKTRWVFQGDFQTHQTGIEFTIGAAWIRIAPLSDFAATRARAIDRYMLQYVNSNPNEPNESHHFDPSAEGGSLILVESDTEFVIRRMALQPVHIMSGSSFRWANPLQGEPSAKEENNVPLWSGRSGAAGSETQVILAFPQPD